MINKNAVDVLGFPLFGGDISKTTLSDFKKFLVPVNIDVMMKLLRDEEFYELYNTNRDNTTLILDSQVILILNSLLLGSDFGGKLSGSDLLPHLCTSSVNSEDNYFLLGGMDNTAVDAMNALNSKSGSNRVVGAYSPSYGFFKNERENEIIIQKINESGANVVAVGLGAPLQEKWIYKCGPKLTNVKNFIAVGATLDFEAGNVSRVPSFFSRIGLEWLYRLILEPKRLFRRYCIECPPFIFMFIKQRVCELFKR